MSSKWPRLQSAAPYQLETLVLHLRIALLNPPHQLLRHRNTGEMQASEPFHINLHTRSAGHLEITLPKALPYFCTRIQTSHRPEDRPLLQIRRHSGQLAGWSLQRIDIASDPCHEIFPQACVIFVSQSVPLLGPVIGFLLDKSVYEECPAGDLDLLVAQAFQAGQRVGAVERYLVHEAALDACGVQGAEGERGAPAGGAAEECGAMDGQAVEEADDLFGEQLGSHVRVCLGWRGGTGEARHVEGEHVMWTARGEEVCDICKTVTIAFTGGYENDVFISGLGGGGGMEGFDVPGNVVWGLNAL